MRHVEIGHADIGDLAFIAQACERGGRLHVAGNSVVPPVELHQIQSFQPQAHERAVDAPFDVRGVDFRQHVQVGNELRVNLHVLGQPRIKRPKPADQRFDPGIDVGAIESGDARLHEGGHIVHRLLRIDDSMVSGEVPSSLDDPRKFISIGHLDAHAGGAYLEIVGTGVAVVALRSNRRLPRRVIRNMDGQFGSGQAISESEYIQS